MHSSGMRTTSLLTVSRSIRSIRTQFKFVRATPPGHPAQCMLGYTPLMDRQTLVKTLPSQTSFAGDNNDLKYGPLIIIFACFFFQVLSSALRNIFLERVRNADKKRSVISDTRAVYVTMYVLTYLCVT